MYGQKRISIIHLKPLMKLCHVLALTPLVDFDQKKIHRLNVYRIYCINYTLLYIILYAISFYFRCEYGYFNHSTSYMCVDIF